MKTKTNKESPEVIRSIKRLLRYEDGKVYWKSDMSQRVKAGDRSGSYASRGYRDIRIKGKNYREHRIVWVLCNGSFPDEHLDHINGVKDDNRIENLRESNNIKNARAFLTKRNGATSKFRGVHWSKKERKYKAQIVTPGRKTLIGSFHDEIEAAKAYDRAAIEHGFDIQALNFKPEP